MKGWERRRVRGDAGDGWEGFVPERGNPSPDTAPCARPRSIKGSMMIRESSKISLMLIGGRGIVVGRGFMREWKDAVPT